MALSVFPESHQKLDPFPPPNKHLAREFISTFSNGKYLQKVARNLSKNCHNQYTTYTGCFLNFSHNFHFKSLFEALLLWLDDTFIFQIYALETRPVIFCGCSNSRLYFVDILRIDKQWRQKLHTENNVFTWKLITTPETSIAFLRI